MPKIDKIMQLSTGHLCAGTADVLHDSLGGDGPVRVCGFVRECGFVVYVDPEKLIEEDPSIPSDLLKTMQFARGHRCEWIMFDRDECPIEDLPLFEW